MLGQKPAEPARHLTFIMRSTVLTSLLACLLVFVAACTSNGGVPAPPMPPGHLHGLDVNPADGRLYAASHDGLFVLESGRFEKVGDTEHDLMGFSIVGADHFLASGHPEDVSSANPMGLIESRDGGRNWQPISRVGESDFHAIETVGGSTYAYDAMSQTLEVSTDGGLSFTVIRAGATLDFGVNAAGDILTTTPSGQVHLFDRSGKELLGTDNPLLTYVDVTDSGWAGLDDHAHVWVLDDRGRWVRVGRLSGTPAAFTIEGERWWAATSAGVFHSDDQGKSWSAGA